MDAITYFFVNLGLLNFLIALLSLIIGIIIGYLLWARYKKQYLAAQHLSSSQESELRLLREENKSLSLAEKSDNSSTNNNSNEQKDKEIQNLKASLDACEKKNQKINGDLQSCEVEKKELNAKLQATAQNSLKTEELNLTNDNTTEIPETPISDNQVADSSDDLEQKSINFFSSQIESGQIVKDDELGLLYTSKPDEEDDLTLIKGVAGVLKGKLNDFGIYTFRQIVLWTPEVANEFSDRLSFKGRVERDDWKGQAKQFHKEKYNESI